MDAAIYEDEDGVVLWRDRKGKRRQVGTLIVGENGRLYLVLRVGRLRTERSEVFRVLLQAVD